MPRHKVVAARKKEFIGSSIRKVLSQERTCACILPPPLTAKSCRCRAARLGNLSKGAFNTVKTAIGTNIDILMTGSTSPLLLSHLVINEPDITARDVTIGQAMRAAMLCFCPSDYTWRIDCVDKSVSVIAWTLKYEDEAVPPVLEAPVPVPVPVQAPAPAPAAFYNYDETTNDDEVKEVKTSTKRKAPEPVVEHHDTDTDKDDDDEEDDDDADDDDDEDEEEIIKPKRRRTTSPTEDKPILRRHPRRPPKTSEVMRCVFRVGGQTDTQNITNAAKAVFPDHPPTSSTVRGWLNWVKRLRAKGMDFTVHLDHTWAPQTWLDKLDAERDKKESTSPPSSSSSSSSSSPASKTTNAFSSLKE